MSISLEGLQSGIAGEERALAVIKVNHNNSVYDWQMYIPPEVDLSAYIQGNEARVKAEIDRKEAEWAALTPKTREVSDPMTGETQTVAIDKSEVVRPDVPDYYAKRRADYPPLGEQLDAMWKGGDAAAAMTAKIAAIKAKYPKP